MDADSLYNESRGQVPGLSHRSLVLAIRYGLADWQNGVDAGKMLAAIESGDVWKMRGVGKRTVQQWCCYIVQLSESSTQKEIPVNTANLRTHTFPAAEPIFH